MMRGPGPPVSRFLSLVLSFLWFAAAANAVHANPRELPQCRGVVVTGEMREVAREAKVDPAKAYTKKRRKVPANVACESALWSAAHAAPGKTVAGRKSNDGRGPWANADATPTNDKNPVEPVLTPPLRDVAPTPAPRPEDPERTLVRNEPEELPRPEIEADVADVSRQTVMGPVSSAPVSTGVSFEGVGTGIPGYFPGVAPPDTNGHIGATQYVQWNNLDFAVWDKSGKLLYGPAAGNTIFKPLGGICGSHNDGDPVASYDILAGRWVLSQFVVRATPNYSHQCVAISATSDALGAYYLYDFVTDASNFVDYPHMAVWPDGYYMAAHIFSSFSNSYLGGRIYVFEREKMLQGLPARLLSANLPAVSSRQQYGMLAADVDSLTPPPAGEAEFVLGPDPQSNEFIDSTRVAVTWGSTPSITLSPTTRIAVTPLPLSTCGGRSCVPQPPPADSYYDYLDDIDLHFMYRLAYRNFGGAPVQESLVATQTGGSAVGAAHDVLRWYELRNSGSSANAPTVYQQSTYDPDLAWRWMGSIAMDKDHDIALGYNKSSTAIKAGIYMTGRLGTDVLNTMGTEMTVQAGGGIQLDTGNRWGDYSAMTLDPIDQCTFWFTSEYYQTNGSWNWATHVASYKFPSCTPAPAWGTVSGAITSCDTGAPIADVIITLSNGYAGASDATGHYSIVVPAGSYTAAAADSGRNCLNSSPVTVPVNVSSGGTVTQNFCMNGISNLQMTASALDDSVTGNGNGIINANECFRFNVTLKNRGCGSESAIAATLTTSTAGVTIRQGSSSYSNLTVDGSAANATPFRLETASNFVCGTTINLTLAVTYAGGTKSFLITLPTCAVTQTIPSSSITASDPTEPNRLYRDGAPSTCSGKSCPGDYDYGIRNYKSFTFTNPGAATACITVKINAACGGATATDIESVAYLGSYDPANRCKNYLGDSAIGGLGTSTASGSYSFNVPASSSFVVIVAADEAGGTCAHFDGLVSGLVDLTPGPGSCCNSIAAPAISAGGPATFCAGDSVTLTSSANSGNQWSLNGNTIAGATNKTYNATASGNYTVTTTTVDGCTSTASAAFVVTVNPLPATPVISAGGPTTFCTGGFVWLTSSSATGNHWYLNGTPIIGATSQEYGATSSGNYTLTVTAGCMSAPSAATVITVNPIPAQPTISAGGPTTICAGQNVVLTSSSASGNQWYLNGSAINGATASQYAATATGNYSVIATANACASPASSATTVSVTPLPAVPTINAGGATTFCAGGSVTLTSSSASGNQWYRNGTLIAGATQQTYDATTSGAYTVTTTANACASSSIAQIVTVNPTPATPVITAGSSTSFCPGSSVTLTSSSATGNQWYRDGNALDGATNQQYTATTAGDYTVIATINGCTSAVSVATSVAISPVPATPAVTAGGATTFCAGGNVLLTSDSATGNQWYRDGNPIAGGTNPQYAATTGGDYTVKVTAAGCASAASNATTITVIPLPATPVISANGPLAFCNGGSVTLTSSSATGNQWYLDGNPLNGETSPQYVATAAGNYTVVVTAGGCDSLMSAVTIVSSSAVPATPVITPGGATTFCSGSNVVLTSSSAAGNQWYRDGNAISGATNQQYTATASGNYTAIVTTGGCSSSASAAAAVTVDPTPATPAITAGGATSFCIGGSVTLTSSSATGNQWYAGGNAINGATAQTYNATTSGNYTVIVTTGNCTSAASAPTVVTVSVVPPQPTIAAGGPTTFCGGASVTLTSSSASGNQWYLNGNVINGATNQQFAATASGNYTVMVTTSGCSGAASAATSVTVNPAPATPTITANGVTTFCTGGNVTLTSSSANGNQWYVNGNAISTATDQQYVASAAGNYTVKVTANGCTSAVSAATAVTVNTLPPAPAITAGSATTFCAGGHVTLTSNNAAGNQWFLNGNAINGATTQQYVATASGNYTVRVNNGCASALSAATVVTVTPVPATPAVTANGPVSFCGSGGVTLTSSSAAGNQWYRNSSAINDANGQTFLATIPGDYMVIVNSNGCNSQPSAVTTVTSNPVPNATITVQSTLVLGNLGTAYVSPAGAGATYQWTITNGTITSGATASFINFTATAAGPLTLTCTVSNGTCSDTKTATVTVTVFSPVIIYSITPSGGSIKGGTNVSIHGSYFLTGATVTIGGAPATNVVRFAFDTITATTPAHVAGNAAVTVTNTDATSATLQGAFKYAQQTDPNGDNVVDPSDIFYLVSYLFTKGPAPVGTSGMLSGDANGDAVVDPADIFYLVNYLFTGGSTPFALTPGSASKPAPIAGTLSFGDPVHREGHDVVPVIFTAAEGASAPQAISISIRKAGTAVIHHPVAAEMRFAIGRRFGDRLSYIAVFDTPLVLDANRSAVVAQIELHERARGERFELDPELTILSNAAGTEKVRFHL
jgi:IPT/TIG domain